MAGDQIMIGHYDLQLNHCVIMLTEIVELLQLF